VVWSRLAAFILISILKVYFIYSHKNVIWFGFAYSLDLLVVAVFLFTANRYFGIKWKTWRFSVSMAGDLLRFAWPLILTALLITMHTKVDQVMLHAYLGNTTVGIYAVACQFSLFWLFIPTLLASTLMPYFVKLRETDQDKYSQQLQHLYSFIFWIAVLAGVITTISAEKTIAILYGEAYQPAAPIVQTMVWSGLFIAQALMRGIWLIAENLQKYRFYNNILAVITNIGMNFLLIPRFGRLGAAMATLLSQSLGTWLYPFLWQPMRASNLQMIKAIQPRYLLASVKQIYTMTKV